MIETIERAAILYDCSVYSVPRPGRHHDVCHKMVLEYGLPTEAQHNQGFVTNTGRFVDRREACIIATAAGQIKNKTFPLYELFSEDMW